MPRAVLTLDVRYLQITARLPLRPTGMSPYTGMQTALGKACSVEGGTVLNNQHLSAKL